MNITTNQMRCYRILIALICCLIMCSLAACSEEKQTQTTSAATTQPTMPIETEHIHQWKAATCLEPKTCETCNEVEGEISIHHYSKNVCVDCGLHKSVEGLQFTKAKDGAYYLVSGYVGGEKHVVIPEMYKGLPVLAIAESAFEYNLIITSIELPEGIIRIEAKAFANCHNIEKIVIPNSVEEIKVGAFFDSGIKEIHIGSGLKK